MALLWAIIDEAIGCLDLLFRMDPERLVREQMLRASDVVEWIQSEDTHYGSWVYCCQGLGVDPRRAGKRIVEKRQIVPGWRYLVESEVGPGRYAKIELIGAESSRQARYWMEQRGISIRSLYRSYLGFPFGWPAKKVSADGEVAEGYVMPRKRNYNHIRRTPEEEAWLREEVKRLVKLHGTQLRAAEAIGVTDSVLNAAVTGSRKVSKRIEEYIYENRGEATRTVGGGDGGDVASAAGD